MKKGDCIDSRDLVKILKLAGRRGAATSKWGAPRAARFIGSEMTGRDVIFYHEDQPSFLRERVTLSAPQHSLLRELADNRPMPMERARELDQRSFRSLLQRGWVRYRPPHGFHLTKLGRSAWNIFNHTDILREHIDQPLTSAFDLARRQRR